MELVTKEEGRNAVGGSPHIRDILSVVAFLVLVIALFVRLAPHVAENVTISVIALLVAYLGADFISGLFHWMGDTWGTTDMPILGQAFVKPFRDHHIDQKEITRHGFIEVNGNNCLISLPFAFGAHYLPFQDGHWFWIFAATSMGTFVTWIFATNQFHKWSHMEDVPALVKWLQARHLILPPVHHSIHHSAPYAKYYCITVGWLNAPLDYIKFYRRLEWLVSKVTGMVPREDEVAVAARRAANLTR
jgi:ubiquitin-conjugating enzyme E2 variant